MIEGLARKISTIYCVKNVSASFTINGSVRSTTFASHLTARLVKTAISQARNGMRFWGAPAAMVFSLLQIAAAFSQGLSAGDDGLSLKNTLETLDQRFNELPAWREGGTQVNSSVMSPQPPIIFLGRWVYLESSFGRTSVALAATHKGLSSMDFEWLCGGQPQWRFDAPDGQKVRPTNMVGNAIHGARNPLRACWHHR